MTTSLSTSTAAKVLPLSRQTFVEPRMSLVIVPTVGAAANVDRLASELPHIGSPAVEVLVAIEEVECARELQRRRQDIRCVPTPSDAGSQQMREAVFRQATGSIVAIVDLPTALDETWQRNLSRAASAHDTPLGA